MTISRGYPKIDVSRAERKRRLGVTAISNAKFNALLSGSRWLRLFHFVTDKPEVAPPD
jgi:hypothetical protein